MANTLFKEGATLICTQTFGHNGKTIPAGKEYLVTESTTTPRDENKPHIVQTKLTLEIKEDNPSKNICVNPQLEGDQITKNFRLK